MATYPNESEKIIKQERQIAVLQVVCVILLVIGFISSFMVVLTVERLKHIETRIENLQTERK